MLMVYHVVWCRDNLEYTPENNSCTNRCNELTINCDYIVISIITINTLNLNVLEYDKWFEKYVVRTFLFYIKMSAYK